MKFNLLITTLLFVTFSFSQSKGTLTGAITDKEANNSALPFANVAIKGTSIAVTTNETGNYTISLNPGNYVVQFSFIGYENVEKSVTIKAGETSTLNCSLGSGNYTLKDVVVKSTSKNREKETALLLEQKKAVEIKQSIGAQEMARKGVSDVEEGLTKITGISKVESRGLFVRGLENRYNNLLINELQAPSNSPFKKIIPLDLFPTDIVGVLNVYKTFNPNISGDFAGATINIETKEAQSPITKLSVGFGFVTENNGSEFLLSESANNDQGFLGIQKKYRELPSTYGKFSGITLRTNEYLDGYKNNSFNVDNVGAPINNSISFLHSDKIKFNDNRSFSYLISLNGDNKYQVRKGIERRFEEGLSTYSNDLYSKSYAYQTNASSLISLKYKSNRLNLSTNSIYIRTTESLIKDQFGVFSQQFTVPNKLVRTNQFEQTDYFNNQLNIGYKLTSDNKHSVKGGISYVKTLYELPDRKFLDGQLNGSTFDNNYGGNNLNRQNFSIKGNYYVSGMFEYNLNFGNNSSGKTNKVTIGANSFKNSLSSIYRFFATRPFVAGYTAPNDLNTINNQIIDDVTNGLIYEKEESNAEYKTKLNQFVNAGYINALYNIGEKIEISGGVRYESSDRIIKYRSLNEGDLPDGPYRKLKELKNYLLPSLNSKYIINDKSNLRLAASKSITRPVLMELLPVQFVNPDGTVERGNENLVDTQNTNIDLKYEFFSKSNDMFVIGLFGKNIQDPIERVFAASANQLTTFQNSKVANLYGAEIEFLFNMKHISENLKDVSLGFNSSIMKTKVDIAEKNTTENEPSRELQGASNWLVNADIKYDFNLGKEIKNTISLVYNVKGKNIYAVGTNGLDHIYEMPFGKLDFIYSCKLTEKIETKLSIDNILNPYQRFELGENSKINFDPNTSLITKEYKKGIGFGLNLSYTF